MGLFSLVGGIIGSKKASKASKKAQKAMVDAYNKGIAEQTRQYDTTRADFAQYREDGYAGLGQLGDIVGIHGGDKQNTAIEALKASPFYQQLFSNGEEALLQNASATGGIRGGNTQGALADFGRDTLLATIQDQLSNLGGLAGMGMGATESVANFGQHKSDAVTSLLSNIGGAKASGLMYRGGLAQQNWNNAGAFADQAVQAALGAMGGGPGGSGGFNFGQFMQGF